MKKIIALLLVLVLMALSLAACGDEPTPDETPCTSHIDLDLNGKCDNCQADVESVIDNTVGLVFSDAIIAQLEQTQSAILEFSIDLIEDDSEWNYVLDDETSEYTKEENDRDYEQNVGKVTIAFAKTKSGVNLKVSVSSKYREDPDDEYEVENDNVVQYYLIDGVEYTYDKELDAFMKREIVANDDVLETLEQILSGVTVTEEETDAVLSELGKLAITLLGVQNNVGVLSYDAKPIMDDLKAYFDELDPETDTLEKVTNDVLALINEELTVEALLDEIARVGALTIDEALAEIDATLTEEYGTTLQGIYDTIVNDARVQTIIANVMSMEEASSDDIAEYITSLKEFKIAEAIPEEAKETPLYDMLMRMTTEPDEEDNMEYDDLATFIENIGMVLDLPLVTFEEEIIGIPFFTGMKENIQYVTIDALNGRTDITFSGLFNIGSISSKTNMDMTTAFPSSVEGKTDTSHVVLSMELTLSQISKETVEIVLPEETEIYNDGLDRYFDSEANERLYMSLAQDNTLRLELWIPYEGNKLYACVDGVDLSVLKSNSITINCEDVTFTLGDLIATNNATNDLVIELDYQKETFVLTGCPTTFKIPVNIIDAMNEIGCGEGVDNSNTYDLMEGIWIKTIDKTSQCIYVSFSTDYVYSGLTLDYVVDGSTGNLICTVTNLIVESDVNLYRLDLETSYYGGCSDTDTLNAYFDGDVTVTISIDENNVITIEDPPVIQEQYIAENNRTGQ